MHFSAAHSGEQVATSGVEVEACLRVQTPSRDIQEAKASAQDAVFIKVLQRNRANRIYGETHMRGDSL